MNRKDLIPVLLMVALIPLWLYVDRHFIAPKFPARPPAQAAQAAKPEPVAGNIESSTLSAQPEEIPAETPVAEPTEAEPAAPEQTAILGNEKMRVEFTSHGGGIKSVTLFDYPQFDQKDSPPVVLDFSNAPALAYQGLEGIDHNDALAMNLSDDGKTIVFSKQWNSDVSFQRTITLGDNYLMQVRDSFSNAGPDAWNLPATRLLTGRMRNPAGREAMRGFSTLGVDSYSPTNGIAYWGRSLNKLFGKEKPLSIDTVPAEMQGAPADWVAAKNMFFVQILSLKQPVATMSLLADRDQAEKGVVPTDVAAALVFKPAIVEARSCQSLDLSFYVGPKQYSSLKAAGNHMEKVMEFETVGFWSWMNWLMEPSRKALLWTLNRCHDIIPSYGVAIIVLTLLVRILFWPLTHKSTESMKRMQELQPEIKALQEKYKKNPQRLQQETMKLYKEKKVNPMGGCLPMFVQIPVFIALYTVLRNAIELRYASFLWIKDLSSPENLLAGHVPLVGSLNILPLLMSASMVWQQKMTPTAAATPEQQQQQKMMMVMMPLMMLFFFYKMPSGLVLYWTTSNLLVIAQTAIRNQRKKLKKA